MTRFDADTPTDRRKLFADAVTAHRNRGSAFLTVEAEPLRQERAAPGDAGGADIGDADAGDAGTGDADAKGDDATPPWVQFAEKTFNLDANDDELERLKDLVGGFPEFRIDQLESPESAEGTNVRITARSDANRLADFLDRVFCEVYGRADDYRVWIVRV